MKHPFAIRRATEADADAIARLSGTLGYETSANVMRQRLDSVLQSNNDVVVVAAQPKGVIMGWLQAHASNVLESGFRVEITGLIVAAEARRHGVGRALVAEAARWARSISAEAVVVRSDIKRTESHQFYPALGFAVTKTQTVYRKWLAKR